MSAPALHLVIDARPRGPSGPLATEMVLGRTLLGRLLELALQVAPADQPIAVHAREDEHELLRGLVGEAAPGRAVLVTGPPQMGAAVLRTDRLYDAQRFRWAVRRGRNLETAAIWRLDRGRSLATAEEELKRRLTYQPLGRFWAFALAERLAEALEPTSVRPNTVTLAAAALMLTAAALVAFAGAGKVPAGLAALALALALVLDTADGRLARLQGTSSAFGRWLDQVLDELADLALHAAIAWSAFASSRQPYWLVLGMLYASGKYLFIIQSLAGEQLEEAWNRGTAALAEPETCRARRTRPARFGPRIVALLKGLVRLAGHADVRWHLWIVLAALGRLDLALAAYAIYFPLRTLAGGLRKGAAHA
ncbi:MAG: CDP-alcohol phosphatidyltransferase family protein [Isosphaeraceae bacterium]